MRLAKRKGWWNGPFLNFQQQLACNGSEVQMVVDPGDAVKAKQATDNNPFLVAPLTFREKEVKKKCGWGKSCFNVGNVHSSYRSNGKHKK